MSSFINFNNRGASTETKYSAKVIKRALLKSETKSSVKAESLVKNIQEPVALNEALVFFTDKLTAIKSLNQAIIDEGNAPFKMKMVGMTLGGKEITDYAPDFWIVTDTEENEVGYVTSPWWSPELETNIALAWVPWEGSEVGTNYKVKLPDEYSITAGVSVDAKIVEVPFRESVNPNKREVQAAKGLDYAD